MQSIASKGKLSTLGIICVLMMLFIILKIFLYLSFYILNPLKNRVVNDMREDIYNRVLALPIGFFTEKEKGILSAGFLPIYQKWKFLL